MKNIIKFSILFAIVFFTNCSEDSKDPIVESNGFTLSKDSSVTSPTILTSADDANIFGKFDWDASNNGAASISSYKLVVFDHDNDSGLQNPIEYTGTGIEVSATTRKATLTVKEFNALINKLPTYKCSEMNIDVRIKSVLGANPETAFIQYSSPINFKVTGYATTAPILAFVKDGNSANVSTEPKLAASAAGVNTDYEGYMYLQPGDYKFYQPDACGDFTSTTVYGGTSGTLSTTAPSITITTAGHYYVKANLTPGSLSYSVSQFTTFGIFGNGTRTGLGTGNHIPMTYNSTISKWELTIKLIVGKSFRFKSNLWSGNTSDLIIPPPNPLFPEYELNPPYVPGAASTAISVLGKSATPLSLEHDVLSNLTKELSVPGTFVVSPDPIRKNYKITLDVSKPRNYTYTLTPQD